MTELWAHSACELARLVRAREVSAREVVQAHLDRIGQVNPALNAVAVVLADSALRAADGTDAALRQAALGRAEPPGPLCGVPMTVKENIHVAGSATTLGIASRGGRHPGGAGEHAGVRSTLAHGQRAARRDP